MRIITEQYIQDKLNQFVVDDTTNHMPAHGSMQIFELPLICIASASDPLFESFKDFDIIGDHFLTPREWLKNAKSVVSYFLPFSKAVRESNRSPGMPSEEWISARIEGEAFNLNARNFLVELFKQVDEEAIAPVLDSRFDKLDFSSNWSERHAAYVAGLGTFGLHKALITEKGCAGRYGSVITSCELTPTVRSYKRHDEYCPYLIKGGCGACIARCPSGAITEEGKQKRTCRQYIKSWNNGCAKCNVKVPCEEGIPTF